MRPSQTISEVYFYRSLFYCSKFYRTILLQVGLAVGDTKTMKKYATIERLVMQLEYQFKIEEAYPKNIIRKVYESVHVEKPNKLSRFNRYTSF